MPFMQNLAAFTQVQQRLDANTNRLTQARKMIDDAVSDINRIESDMAAALAVIDADIAASAASEDPIQQALAGVTMAARTSVFNSRDELLAKAQAVQTAIVGAM